MAQAVTRPVGAGVIAFLKSSRRAIVGPGGDVLGGPLVRERGILTADLELDAARARKRFFDVAGHYNRPEVFRLEVDDRPKPAVVRRGSA